MSPKSSVDSYPSGGPQEGKEPLIGTKHEIVNEV